MPRPIERFAPQGRSCTGDGSRAFRHRRTRRGGKPFLQ